MASRVRSIDFLPEIFKTKTNQQFLSATLDQLVQEPRLKKIQGFVGKQTGIGANPLDDYILEPTVARSNYQLEPGVVFLKEDTSQVIDAITYPGIVDSIKRNRGNVEKHDRLFESEFYTWDPMIDFDKFINFSQYYWLPAGPDSVDVYSTEWPLADEFAVTRNNTGFNISERTGYNPPITLVRGGSYQFLTNQPGHNFYIQATPGAGTMPYAINQSSREVHGVSNNGDDLGTITFAVPEKNAQNFYFTLGDSGTVDLATDLKFTDINNVFLSQLIATHGGIDGIKDLDNRTLIFLNRNTGDNSGWYYADQYDHGADWDADGWDEITLIEDQAQRYSVWKINLVYDVAGENPYIKLSNDRTVPNLNKVFVDYGTTRGGLVYYKDAEGYFLRQPLITAPNDILYYQDSENPDMFGVIKLVEIENRSQLDVNDIIGKTVYTSPNGVVFTNGLKVKFRNDVIPAEYIDQEYYVEGVGSAIVLLPITDYITPELYINGEDSAQDGPTETDYLSINRASRDRNPWARSNRWFHIDVITATSVYNNSELALDNNYRSRRPIIEFLPSLRLFNFGTESVGPITVIDFVESDALSNVNNTTSYSVDGYSVVDGDTIIFATDDDVDVQNKIYRVDFIDPDDSGTDIINLVEIATVIADQVVISLNGTQAQGQSYWFNGNQWVEAQQKTSKNQAPLFDVFDNNGISFGDTTTYTSSTFAGTKLFSYAIGAGAKDSVIEQPLKYYNLNNVGDITFDNNLNVDQFVYVQGATGVTKNISEGFVRQYSTVSDYNKLIGWRRAAYTTVSRQSFKFIYAGSSLTLDIPTKADLSIPAVKVFVDGVFVLPTDYTITENSRSTTITFITEPDANAAIEVQIISDVTSATGFYTVPHNLDKNPLGHTLDYLTLGTIRNHYGTICQNLLELDGNIHGANNTRDLGDIGTYGEMILQQSAPLTLPAVFLKNSNFDFVASLEHAGREYEKYKMLLLDTMAKTDFGFKTTSEILDECVEIVNLGRSESSPFYWSDMLAVGSAYTQTNYTVTPITGSSFDTLRSYDLTTANYRAINVYLNDEILLADGHEYTVAADGNRVDLHVDLAIGDQVSIREYESTVGNYVPSTPTKLGLYPAYHPEKFLDNTYTSPTYVIRGHDGSLTVAFGDFRDDVILEFEIRIYNNLKVPTSNTIPLTATDVIPGQFRSTDYTLAEVNEILASSFLNWVGDNRVDYKTQTYDYNNQFTWNYSSATSKIDNTILLGNWRGIFAYLYDTDSPHTKPWEMLGIVEEPSWWTDIYGPAPYTSGNLVLWEDLEAGTIKNPSGATVVEKYQRNGLTNYIPVDSEGNLRSPFEILVKNYDRLSLQRSWLFGDNGTMETVWRRSSSWPFAVQRLLALTKPAQYFATMIDRDRYVFEPDLSQYVYNGRYRINPADIELYGSGTAKHSYLNWIIDYNHLIGRAGNNELQTLLSNIDVRLCYAVAGFTDKQYLKIFTEKSSPGSENNSLLYPDESYQTILYQNPTIDQFTWSSVIVQRTSSGYAVYGYSTIQPYFEILRSENVGVYDKFVVGNKTYSVSSRHSNEIVQVPYGYEFTTDRAVVDFLISYGKLLEVKGMQFDTLTSNITLSWLQMAQEFVYWVQQGWTSGSVINLNPGAKTIKVSREGLVVEPLSSTTLSNTVLDQNKQPLKNTNYVVERIDNEFVLASLTDSTINHLNIKFTAYEHLLVFDNTSIFNDLMYESKTGARQNRLKLIGYVTDGWNGTLDTAGFILNQDNIEEWLPNRAYSKGQIVKHKGSYWSAIGIIPANEEFSFDQWLVSDYAKVNKGLLPNIAFKSEQMLSYYDSKTSNLEEDANLLGLGLIGFRPRRYMQNLNIDDISQVNLYKEFIKLKGTTQAVDIFGQADLGKEVADYNVYENWAVKRASYGATANRNFVEIRLNEASLKANPAIIEFTNPQQASIADQTVFLSEIWKSSKNIPTINVFPTTSAVTADQQLPSAGYVDIDNVDLFLFDLSDISSLNTNIDAIGDGTVIWVAKDNSYTWNIYRSTQQPAKVLRVRDTLDGRSLITFDAHHNLSKDKKIVIKLFNNLVNAAYTVQEVVDLKNIIVNLRLPANQTQLVGIGVCFTLESTKVNQTSDIIDLAFINSVVDGDRVWVDNDGNDHWAVYTKTAPFTYGTELQPIVDPSLDFADAQHGTSVAQTADKTVVLSGAPGYNSDAGAVYVFNKSGPVYQEASYKLSLDGVSGVVGYGQSLVVGNNIWGAVGAPASLSDGSSVNQGYVAILKRDSITQEFSNWQLLTVPNGDDNAYEFGYSLALTTDERWLYVGAPGKNKVYAYNLVDTPDQSVQYVGNGTTTTFNTTSNIIVSNGTQVGVTVNGNEVAYGVDWSWSAGQVVFTSAPVANDVVLITRKRSIVPSVSAGQKRFSVSSLYTASNIYAFSVFVDGVLLRPYDDYTFNSVNLEIDLVAGLTTTQVIAIRASQYYQYISAIDSTIVGSLGVSDRFGQSLATTTDGRGIIIGAPYQTVDGHNESGQVYVINRTIEKFRVTDPDVTSYTTLRTQSGDATVTINEQYQFNSAYHTDGEYTTSGNTVTFTTTLITGDTILVETNNFELVQTINLNNRNEDLSAAGAAHMGQSLDMCSKNCSLFVGNPDDSVVNTQAGSVDVYHNQSMLYGTLSTDLSSSISLTSGNKILINGFVVTLAGTTLTSLVNSINSAHIPNAQALLTEVDAITSRLTISVINADAAQPYKKLSVCPGTGTLYADLDFEPYSHVQTIQRSNSIDSANFGSKISVDTNVTSMVISAPNGNAIRANTLDNNTTTFDNNATRVIDITDRSGVVYVFDLLPAAAASITNPAKFVFGQEIYAASVQDNSSFGAAINYKSGQLLIGSPLADELVDDSSVTVNRGAVLIFDNPTEAAAWNKEQNQQDSVDTSLINSVFVYHKDTGKTLAKLDYVDPLYGKILGVAKENLDYIGAVDPAAYNIGTINNYGQFWAKEHVGEIWWNTTNSRFVDYHSNDLDFAVRNWGNTVIGSSIDVYQWVESKVPPISYSGPGTVYNTARFVVRSNLSDAGIINTLYYFWVKDVTAVSTQRNKTLSAKGIAQYIAHPKSSGIPFVGAINSTSVALYNVQDYVIANDSILHIEYDEKLNDDNVHIEYDIVADGNAESFVSDTLYRKLLDSFCGVDTLGNKVPDTALSEANAYGVDFRPRQSLFVNRYTALKNYINNANNVLINQPIAESRTFNLLNDEEAEPSSTSNQWDLRVNTYAELTYQDLSLVSTGYRYLVASDSTRNGLWSIYTVQADDTALLTRVQHYDVKQYWSYVDWYLPGYNQKTKVSVEVDRFVNLQTLLVPTNGQVVRVRANSNNKWELYQYLDNVWTRVGLEDGTIQISDSVWNYAVENFGYDSEVFDAQYFDLEPVTETRQIVRAINEELFVGDLLIHRNESVMLMFGFIQQEQQITDWLFKTSLIDVNHNVRSLSKYPTYVEDNQDFILDYIKEVKPYHVKIREFNLRYEGIELFDGSMTDFDIPAYYDHSVEKFISPILDNRTSPLDEYSSKKSTDPVWSTFPWDSWYENRNLIFDSVQIVSGGSGYTIPPIVTVLGDADTPTTLIATINSQGEVSGITVVDAGTPYSSRPIITFNGGNGTGASASAVMRIDLVRSLKSTLKFDRFEYTTKVVDWSTDTYYAIGSLVRYNNTVWSVDVTVDSQDLYSGSSFSLEDYTEVDPDDLAAADRIYGWYRPGASQPGRTLAQLISGIEYPGVHVKALDFADVNTVIDAEYSGDFTDSYLGTRTTDINVAGGGFIDTYSSHAPEELVPGSMFDTLDIRVYTRPGADWGNDGHGWPLNQVSYYFTLGDDLDISDVIRFSYGYLVLNLESHTCLTYNVDYTVDWVNKTLSIASGAADGDKIGVIGFGIGGGNQLYQNEYNGADIGDQIVLPVIEAEIYEVAIVVNGQLVNNYTISEYNDYESVITFTTTYTTTDNITLTVFGYEDVQHSYSFPEVSIFSYSGSNTFTLTNELTGTNAINAVVSRGGLRLRPPDANEYTGDGSTSIFYLPTNGETAVSLISNDDVQVYVNEELQTLSTDYTISANDDSSALYVDFNVAPVTGSRIIVALTTDAGYTIIGNTLTIKTDSVVGTSITVMTFRDTSQLYPLTQVFVGPIEHGTYTITPYDSVDYDDATSPYDYTLGTIEYINQFDTGRAIINPERMCVTLNGHRLSPNEEYTVSGSTVYIAGAAISVADVVAITSITEKVVPSKIAFRITNDMHNIQRIYRITDANTTELAQDLTVSADTIYLIDASTVPAPSTDFDLYNILGVIIVGAEKITYRTRNLVNNTVSGLRRGVAGTSIDEHEAGTLVYNVGKGEQLPDEYQQYQEISDHVGDGVSTTFTTALSVDPFTETAILSFESTALQVYVGGSLADVSTFSVTATDPVTIEFTDAISTGVEVKIVLTLGTILYNVSELGIPLQDNNNPVARFLRNAV